MTDTRELVGRLFEAQVGGCECLTKTPEIKYHDRLCKFRLCGEALSTIESLEARLAAAEKDAGRYRWLKELKCNQLHVQHDDHAANYVTAKEWIENNDPDWFAECDPIELQRMKDANSIWCIQIYPVTPIGFNVYHGATLDAAIDAARSEGEKP